MFFFSNPELVAALSFCVYVLSPNTLSRTVCIICSIAALQTSDLGRVNSAGNGSPTLFSLAVKVTCQQNILINALQVQLNFLLAYLCHSLLPGMGYLLCGVSEYLSVFLSARTSV